jgi:hypothetical protein
MVGEQFTPVGVIYLIDPSCCFSTPGSIVVLDEGIPVTYGELERPGIPGPMQTDRSIA